MDYQIGDLVDVWPVGYPDRIGRGRIVKIEGPPRAMTGGRGIAVDLGTGWGVCDGYDPESLYLIDGPLAPAPDARDQYPDRGSAEARAACVARYADAYLRSIEWGPLHSMMRAAATPAEREPITREISRREGLSAARRMAAARASQERCGLVGGAR